MSACKRIDVAFGRGSIQIQADPDVAEWDVIRPADEPALPEPEQAFQRAADRPTECRPLRELVKPHERVVICTSDGTRPVPNRQLIPWILEKISVPPERVTILLGNGTHRANTPEEIAGMFGEDLARRVRILNHDAFDEGGNDRVGSTAGGTPVDLDRVYLQADKRIAVGFIEPHFFAGFSGGPKAVAPGVAGIETIFRLHRTELIAHPNSTWGVLEENPLHREVREAVALCPPDFMVNVTLNAAKRITGFYVGDYGAAHRLGCAAVKASSMVAVSRPFPVVVTSNSGYPLDQNLYQTVKGISAAARVLEPGGAILVASECSDGVPNHGNFASLMQAGGGPEEVMKHVYEREPILDQWQAQILAGILTRADVSVFARMPAREIESCKMQAIPDLQVALRDCVEAAGADPRVAVLPEGPLTIPYLEKSDARG